MEGKSNEILTKETYENNSYKELKLIIGQKLTSRVIMNPKITESDMQEYNDIMQSVMDDRSEYDSEKLLLPIVIYLNKCIQIEYISFMLLWNIKNHQR